MVFLELYSTSTFLLVSLSYSSSFNIGHNLLHISLYHSLLLATNSSSLLILWFSIFSYALLLVYYSTTELSLLLIPHSLIHTFFPPLTLSFLLFVISSICYSSPLSFLSSAFFISFTTLTTFSSLLLAIFIFSIIFTSSSSITTFAKL